MKTMTEPAYCNHHNAVLSCVRERMVRLQHENQLLKMQSSSDENSQLLQSMLDDANAHKHELECQVRYRIHQSLEFCCCTRLSVWLGGRVVRMLDLQPTGHRFESWPLRCRVQPWASC